MIGENIVRQAAVRRGRQGSMFELYTWFFMRVSGAIMMVIVTYDVIVGRWTGPAGPFWRTFDLLLLLFAFTHGTNGIRYAIDDYIHNNGWRALVKTLLYLVFFVLLVLGAYIIFSFRTEV